MNKKETDNKKLFDLVMNNLDKELPINMLRNEEITITNRGDDLILDTKSGKKFILGTSIYKSFAIYDGTPINISRWKFLTEDGSTTISEGLYLINNEKYFNIPKKKDVKACITGDLISMTRKDYIDLLKNSGIDCSPTMNKQTNILIVASSPGNSKLTEAGNLGIARVGVEFFELCYGIIRK